MEKIQLQLIIDKLSHLGEAPGKSGVGKPGAKDAKKPSDKTPATRKKPQVSPRAGAADILSPTSNSGEEKTELQKEIEKYSKPIYYQGKIITTYSDILDHLDLDLMNKETVRDAQKEIAEKGIQDNQYQKLVERVKPNIRFFEQGLGDKLLFLRRVDKLEYDIMEEHKRKAEKKFLEELEEAKRQMKEGAKLGVDEVGSGKI